MNFATRSKVYRAAAWRKVRNFLGLDTDTYPPRPEGTKLSPSQGLGAATQAITRNNSFDVTNISKWQLDARNRLAEMLGYTKPEAVPETIAQRGPTTVESDRHDLERMTYYLRVRPDTDVPVTTVVRKDRGGPLPVSRTWTKSGAPSCAASRHCASNASNCTSRGENMRS